MTKADAEIQAMEEEEKASKMVVELPKRGTPEHRQQWQSAEAELRQADPEFMKSGSRLDTKLREIFNGPNAAAYADHPQGIYAAYDRAKREILQEDNDGLRTENSSLKKELQRLGDSLRLAAVCQGAWETVESTQRLISPVFPAPTCGNIC